ncbi:MAG: DUF262 domain-containing protein [Synergistaceae bacterium]|nr:DUF262 domain-containing protein [Synergistaceae bacterium]
MNIELHNITVRELFDGYVNSDSEGVRGYHGLLDIRPAFQREFVYKPKQEYEVIRSIMHGRPINVMYWIRSEDGTFELLDGQQRTLSICRFLDRKTEYDGLYFHSFTPDEAEKILGYNLMIYICEGSVDEILEWFEVINTKGEQLNQQEQLNAALTGKWLTDAKRRFSRRNCEAYKLAKEYMRGDPSRQDYLETVIKWIAERDGMRGLDAVKRYMSFHQHDDNANEMWLYFQAVINWVKLLFPETTRQMKGIEWGKFYNKYHTRNYDTAGFAQRIAELTEDEDVTRLAGIYEYLIDGEERHLHIRKFGIKIKRIVYKRQEGICPICGGHFELNEMEADHIIPWSEGGHTVADNCQMLCKNCNRRKSDS